MTISLEKDTLLSALQASSRFSTSHALTTGLSNGCLCVLDRSTLTIHTTNLNDFYRTTLDVTSEDKVTFYVENRKLIEFLPLISDRKIDLFITDTHLSIKTSDSSSSFPIVLNPEFPPIPSLDVPLVSLPQEIFTHMKKILYSSSKDESKPVLNGIYCSFTEKNVVCVTTDGFRLSITQMAPVEGLLCSFILSARFCSEMLSLSKEEKSVSMALDDQRNMVWFSFGRTTLVTRIIDGQFPPYEKVVPDNHTTRIVLSSAELEQDMKRIGIFARDLSNIVICTFSKDEATFTTKKSSNNPSTISRRPISFEGTDVKIAFNYRFILEYLTAIPDEEVSILLGTSLSPVLFLSPKDSSLKHVIMPLRTEDLD
ncbi:MAG: DNA polymerase III subunit beta [Microgenomates bacterium OLB22]|nr:MAG: DNA polymerase III subunit beta [Microgenomates bacterium OLB22]